MHLRQRPGQDFPPRPGATPIVIGFSTPTPTGKGPAGTLAPSDSRTAIRVALASRQVRRLLLHRPYHVAGSGPWNENGAPVGAVVSLRLARPATISGSWLALGGGPYSATYRNVRGLRVYVNVRQQRVMGVIPMIF